MAATKYGKTWWGQKCLETFNGIDFSNRLDRGRTYANTGRAKEIKIKENTVTAKVQGSRPTPYKVEIIFSKFDQKDKEHIKEIITNSSSILSELTAKILPNALFELLEKRNIKLFPCEWDEVKAQCSCPDFAVPCKHIAAVIYLICAEIDKNPFTVFSVHDCDLLNLIGDFNEGKLKEAQKILSIEEILKEKTKEKHQEFDEGIIHSIDFSKITNHTEQIKNLLRNDPPFYDKNFREILELACRHWQRSALKNVEKVPVTIFLPERKQEKKVKKEPTALTIDELLEQYWRNVEQINIMSLIVDDNLSLQKIVNDSQGLIEFNDNKRKTLVSFLYHLPHELLYRFSPSVRFWHLLFQFALKLVENAAFVPQVIQNNKREIGIRWLPALFDQEIREIYEKLCSICPLDLVLHEKNKISIKNQVDIALSILFVELIEYNVPVLIEKQWGKNKIIDLLFYQKFFPFSDYTQKEIPAALNQWLSNLHRPERPYELYLKIDDTKKGFELEIAVILAGKKTPDSVTKIMKHLPTDIKFMLMADASLILEYIPSLQKTIDYEEKAIFNLKDFSTIFLMVFPVIKAIGIKIILPKTLQKILKPQLNLNLNAKKKGSSLTNIVKSVLNFDALVDFDWQIALGDQKIEIDEFKKLLKESRGLVRIVDQYVLFDEKEIEHLLKRLDKIGNNFSAYDILQAALSGEIHGASVDIDKQLQKLIEKIQTYKPIKIPENLHAQLRSYQERGFSWLVQNIEHGFGSILADDMGLGKTIQVIAAMLYFKNQNYLEKDKVLIVVPMGLLSNWKREIERFAPTLKASIYHGNDRFFSDDFDVLLTSYGLLRRDQRIFKEKSWFLLVIDEAQNIKNATTVQTKSLKTIDAQNKIALSGTPVENRLLEYWSIFDFTNKNYLGSATTFKKEFAIPIEKNRDKACLERFKKITSPFILRRVKSDKTIIKDLPEKIENNRYCSLTKEQAALYKELVDVSLKKIEKTDGISRKGLILKLITSLKQICNHPVQFEKKGVALLDASGKIKMLDEILSSIDELGEKALIFTQYTEMGEIISKLMEEKFKMSIPFLYGQLSTKKRDELVHGFQNSPQNRFLIVSLKAGGTGLNLTAANHVIHYDLWWNPAVEAQATDRAYRIGQNKDVLVYRLLTTGTLEERINEIILSKKELANLTVDSGESWITEMTTDQLKDLVSLRNTISHDSY